MARKFQLSSIPSTPPKNIRFPNDLIEKVNDAIRRTNVTFSKFVIEATRVAVESIREDAASGLKS